MILDGKELELDCECVEEAKSGTVIYKDYSGDEIAIKILSDLTPAEAETRFDEFTERGFFLDLISDTYYKRTVCLSNTIIS